LARPSISFRRRLDPRQRGQYEIVSLRPADGGSPQYRIKSKNESHERVVSEGDLILFQI
jgi:hypothetical protein